MEAVAVIFVPLVLLWFGLSLAQGHPPTPDAVMRMVNRLIAKGLRWLWKEKPNRGGTGRPRRPPNRYRR